MSTEDIREVEIVDEIRKLAGELGGLRNPRPVLDAANEKEFKVEDGLANAVFQIFDLDRHRMVTWLGTCLHEMEVGHGDSALWFQPIIEKLHDEVDARVGKEPDSK